MISISVGYKCEKNCKWINQPVIFRCCVVRGKQWMRHAEATPPGSGWVSEMALPPWQRTQVEEEGEVGQLTLTITMAAHTCSRSTHGWLPIPPPAATLGEYPTVLLLRNVKPATIYFLAMMLLKKISRVVCLNLYIFMSCLMTFLYSLLLPECRRMQQQPLWSQTLPRRWGWTLVVCMCWQRWRKVVEKSGCWKPETCRYRGFCCGLGRPRRNTLRASAFTSYYR